MLVCGCPFTPTYVNTNSRLADMLRLNFMSKILGNESTIDQEPIHVEGHSTEVTQQGTEYMCPECGKTFPIKDEAERHLHGIHRQHLRTVHGEFHDKDVDGMHVS